MPLTVGDALLAFRKGKAERAVYVAWAQTNGYKVRFDSDGKEETVYRIIPLPKGKPTPNVKPTKAAEPAPEPEPSVPVVTDAATSTRIAEQGTLF